MFKIIIMIAICIKNVKPKQIYIYFDLPSGTFFFISKV